MKWVRAILIAAVVLVLISGLMEAFGESAFLGVLLVALFVCACIWLVQRRNKKKADERRHEQTLAYLRESPEYVRGRMEEVRAILRDGWETADGAELELGEGRAPLFWDRMEGLLDVSEKYRTLRREVEDRVEYYRDRAMDFGLAPDAVELNQSVVPEYSKLSDRWRSLYLSGMANQVFAHVYELRCIRNTFVDGQNRLVAELEQTTRAARSAEQAAIGAEARAGEAVDAAGRAAGDARDAASAARSIKWWIRW